MITQQPHLSQTRVLIVVVVTITEVCHLGHRQGRSLIVHTPQSSTTILTLNIQFWMLRYWNFHSSYTQISTTILTLNVVLNAVILKLSLFVYSNFYHNSHSQRCFECCEIETFTLRILKFLPQFSLSKLSWECCDIETFTLCTLKFLINISLLMLFWMLWYWNFHSSYTLLKVLPQFSHSMLSFECCDIKELSLVILKFSLFVHSNVYHNSHSGRVSITDTETTAHGHL
jgi:hypothetical protein